MRRKMKPKQNDPEKLLKKHPELIHSELRLVASHVQRENDEWIVNTLMIEGCEVPFQYRRKKSYQSLRGARVNLTYYPDTQLVAGIEVETMRVVRVRVA